ncbi:MAG: RDD family protein [Acidobacteria bacterium]|nr:RDD family protein [Acidobacteriota bacterium]
MNCRYCGAQNDTEESRCGRCGRRLDVAIARPAESFVRGTADLGPRSASAVAVKMARVAQPLSSPQVSLFPTAPPKARVVPITGHPAGPDSPEAPSAPKPARTARKITSVAPSAQQPLAFSAPGSFPAAGEFAKESGNGRPAASQESEIFTQAPVATAAHRSLAMLVDAGLVAAGVGVMLALFVYGVKTPVSLDRTTAIGAVGLTVISTILYQSLLVIGNRDSVGLRFARLRLIDFDGRSPSRKKRLARMAASWLSSAPGALGIVWALLDEEHLTWHDHISKVFPTPIDVPRIGR